MGGKAKFSARAEAHCRVDEKRERAHNGWMTLSRKRKMEARSATKRGPTKGRDRVGDARATNFRMCVCATRLFLCYRPGPPCKMSASSLLSEREYRYKGGSVHEATLRVPSLLFTTMVNGSITGVEISGQESRELFIHTIPYRAEVFDTLSRKC